MINERERLTLAPRETILAAMNQISGKHEDISGIEANIPGSFCSSMMEENPTMNDNDVICWYGLINPEAILTSITSVFVNFKRDYILLADTGNKETSAVKIVEIIIDFNGVEVNDELKDAVNNLATMLLNEYNPKVV